MPGCYLCISKYGSSPGGQAMCETSHNQPFFHAFYHSLFVADGQVSFMVQILGNTLPSDQQGHWAMHTLLVWYGSSVMTTAGLPSPLRFLCVLPLLPLPAFMLLVPLLPLSLPLPLPAVSPSITALPRMGMLPRPSWYAARIASVARICPPASFVHVSAWLHSSCSI